MSSFSQFLMMIFTLSSACWTPLCIAQEYGIHDPCLIKQGDTYVLFSTGGLLPMRRSSDLMNWQRGGDALSEIPLWAKQIVPESKGCWAPDIAFFDGEYHLYYSISTFGKNRSCIGLATNVTLDPADPRYVWQDQGEVIRSRPMIDDFNAIDPNIVLDSDGQPWMSFGSFWNGIYLTQLDLVTGKPAGPLSHIAGRNRGPIEAPFIVHHEKFFYLFVSFDFCCKGVGSTYKIMVGRSERVEGPYMDHQGRSLVDGGGTLLLASHENTRGPGHNAVLTDNGRDWLVHHAYDATRKGRSMLQVRPLLWSDAGWPLAGEPDLSTDEGTLPNWAGTWEFWIDYEQQQPLTLISNGQVESQVGATWKPVGTQLELSFPTVDQFLQTTKCHVDPEGRWFVGRDPAGRILRGVRRLAP